MNEQTIVSEEDASLSMENMEGGSFTRNFEGKK
jgi:hypothetical protein